MSKRHVNQLLARCPACDWIARIHSRVKWFRALKKRRGVEEEGWREDSILTHRIWRAKAAKKRFSDAQTHPKYFWIPTPQVVKVLRSYISSRPSFAFINNKYGCCFKHTSGLPPAPLPVPPMASFHRADRKNSSRCSLVAVGPLAGLGPPKKVPNRSMLNLSGKFRE